MVIRGRAGKGERRGAVTHSGDGALPRAETISRIRLHEKSPWVGIDGPFKGRPGQAAPYAGATFSVCRF